MRPTTSAGLGSPLPRQHGVRFGRGFDRGRLASLRGARAAEAITRRVLVLVRVLMGVMLVACGLNGFFGFMPVHGAPIHDGAVAFGSALLLASSLLPLLKGTEVIVETLLDTVAGYSRR